MRLVSLLASATEMIAALGCLDQLAGRSHECDYPPEVLSLPVVSTVQINIDTSSADIDAQIKQLAQTRSTLQDAALKALSIYAIDIDQLQALRPDVIFTQTQCEVCAVSERQALGRRAEAETLVQDYQQRLDRLSTITANFGTKPRVTVLEWLDPLMAAGNWTPELVDYAGGENIFGEVGLHLPWLSWEELQAADPDVLVLSPCGYTIERTLMDVPLLQQHPAWQSLRAVQTGRVYAIDGNHYLNRSGPRLVDSAELLGRVIWGEQLGIEVDMGGWRHV